MLLLALGCLRATHEAPFSLGRLKSALLAQQDTTAIVLLTDAELSCGAFEQELNNQVPEEDTTLWSARGVLLQLWLDGDLEGTYLQGSVPLSHGRTFQTVAFDRGEVWDDDHPATLELGEGGQGLLEGTWVEARFTAEPCGDEEPS